MNMSPEMKLYYLWSSKSLTRMTRPLSEQNIVFSTNGPVQLDSHMQNNEIELLSHHIQKLT